ncbi:MAG: thioesterase family protein [Acidobacteriaceae bacterium]
MEVSELIQPGMTREDSFLITQEYSAIHIGSGSSRVLATPWMIAFMERVSHRLLTCCLPEGFSSVGTHLDVRHLAPTPVGVSIRVRTEVLSIEDNRVYFSIEAWDDLEKIGAGKHERVVIDEARFLRRVEKKKASL